MFIWRICFHVPLVWRLKSCLSLCTATTGGRRIACPATRKETTGKDHWLTAGSFGRFPAVLLPKNWAVYEEEMIWIPIQVLFSLLFWSLLYLSFSWWNKQHKPEWSCRLVTLIHGVVITIFSGYIALIDGPWPLTHTGHPNTPLQVHLLCLTLGYFLFDLGWCMYFSSESELMLIHHVLSIWGMVLVLALEESATEINAIIFVSEITNPLLQTRWFLRDMGWQHLLVADVVDYLFSGLFLVCRIIAGAWIVHAVLTSPKTILVMKGGVLAMYAVSLHFFLDICRFLKKKITKKYYAWKDEITGREALNGNGNVAGH